MKLERGRMKTSPSTSALPDGAPQRYECCEAILMLGEALQSGC